MERQRGFTLTELMITVVIVGILTSIAVPSYQNYVITGRIADATSELAARRVSMEQYYQDKLKYESGAAACSTANNTEYFNFSCDNVTNTSYTIKATGQKSMAGFVYTINEKNLKATTSVKTGWTLPSTASSCWVTKNGSC